MAEMPIVLVADHAVMIDGRFVHERELDRFFCAEPTADDLSFAKWLWANVLLSKDLARWYVKRLSFGALPSDLRTMILDVAMPGSKLPRETTLRRFGIGLTEYAAMLFAQNGRCAICQLNAPVAIDHDHATGKIRGLLCTGCNVSIGRFGDDPETLRRAAEYIETAR